MIIKSLCLPYFSDSKVYIYACNFDKYGDKQIVVRVKDFENITTDGGSFNQFYTFKVKNILN